MQGMKPIIIQVKCHAGYKADERPTAFTCEDNDVVVEQVLDQWLQAGKDQYPPKVDYFKVLGNDKHEYLLKHDLDLDEWWMENRW